MKSNSLYESLLQETIFSDEKNLSLRTGIKSIDKTGFKIEAGELIFLGAWNPVWSTQFLVNISINIGNDHQISFYTFDSSEKKIANKFCSVIANRRFHEMNKFDNVQLERIERYGKSLNIKVIADGNTTLKDIKHDSYDDIRENNLKFLIIDQFEFINYKKPKTLNHICRKLLKFAKKQNICIIISEALPIKKFINTNKEKTPSIEVLKLLKINPGLFDKILFLHNDEYFGINNDFRSAHKPNIDFIIERDKNGYTPSNILLAQDKYFNILNDVLLD